MPKPSRKSRKRNDSSSSEIDFNVFLCEVDFPNYELMNENADLSQAQSSKNSHNGSVVSIQTLNADSNQLVVSSSSGNLPHEMVELENKTSVGGYNSVEENVEKKRINYLDVVENVLKSLKDEDKPWINDSSLTNHHFNFGFNETTWLKYCERRRELSKVINQLPFPVVNKQVEPANAQLLASYLSVPPEVASLQNNATLVVLPSQKDTSSEKLQCQMECDSNEKAKESLKNENPGKKSKEKKKMHKKKVHRTSPYSASVSREIGRRTESLKPQGHLNPRYVDSKRRCDPPGNYIHVSRRVDNNIPDRMEHPHYASSFNSRGYDDYNDWMDYNHYEPYPAGKGRSNHARGEDDWQTSNENNSCSRNDKRKSNDFQHPIHKRARNM